MGRGTRRRWSDIVDLALIGSAHAMSDGFSNLLVPVVALIAADLSLSDINTGVLLSVFSLASFLLVFPLSLLADRSGRKLIMLLAGLALAAGAYAVMPGVNSYHVLLVVAFTAGAGNSVYHPCGTALTATRFPHVKPQAISIHGMMGNIGAGLMPIVLALVSDAYGWRIGVAACTVPMLFLLPTIGVRFRKVEAAQVRERTVGDSSAGATSIALSVLRHRPVLLLAVVYALSGMATKAAIGFFPVLATRRFGFSTSEIGLLLSLYFGMGIVAKPVMGFIYAGQGPRKALLFPLAVSFVATLIAGLVPSPAVFVTAVAVLGATSPISPVILTAAADVTEMRVLASSVGLIYSLHAIGFVAPAIAGLLSEHVGISAVYAFSGALFFLAAASAGLWWRKPSAPLP